VKRDGVVVTLADLKSGARRSSNRAFHQYRGRRPATAARPPTARLTADERAEVRMAAVAAAAARATASVRRTAPAPRAPSAAAIAAEGRVSAAPAPFSTRATKTPPVPRARARKARLAPSAEATAREIAAAATKRRADAFAKAKNRRILMLPTLADSGPTLKGGKWGSENIVKPRNPIAVKSEFNKKDHVEIRAQNQVRFDGVAATDVNESRPLRKDQKPRATVEQLSREQDLEADIASLAAVLKAAKQAKPREIQRETKRRRGKGDFFANKAVERQNL
jgi:hypothetical protein